MDSKSPTKNAKEFADDLFEACNLAEIESLQNNLKKDVEKKADQLKSLVSEKYRDLIDAADTIRSMATIVNDITSVTDNILKSNQFNNNQTVESHNNVPDRFAAQMKLLIDLSEQIWDRLSSKNYLTATQFYQFALCIKTSLYEDVSRGLKECEPFLDRIWSSISHFPATISENTRLELSNLINPENAACCFISLSILEQLDIYSLINEFIVLRTNVIQHTLTEENSPEKNIENSFHLIVNTIYNLYVCFTNYDNYNSGLIEIQIEKDLINGPSVLSLVDLDYSLQFGLNYIPNSVRYFKTNHILFPNNCSKEHITDTVKSWMIWARSFIETRVPNVLDSIQSFSTLNHLNQLSIDYPLHWNAILAQFRNAYDPWYTIYCPLFVNRTKILLTDHWEDVFSKIISDVNNALTQPVEPHLQDSLFSDTDDCLGTRSIGCSDRAAELCACVKRRISSMSNILIEFEFKSKVLDTFALRQHQRHCCINFIIRLTRNMLQIVERESTSEHGILLVARFLWCLPELCPKLKQCLVSIHQEFNSWPAIKEEIHKASTTVWNRWIDVVTNKLFDGLKGNIFPITLGEQLSTIPKWETVDMEVEKESGELVMSKLQVPNQPSFPLQNFIHNMITCLALTLPPKFVQDKTIALCVEWILLEYRDNSVLETSLKSRHQIQKLFDLKYINQLFIGVENESLANLCSEQISAVESLIDPINLDVLGEYLVKNVKRAVISTKCAFGTKYPGQMTSECSDEANNLMFSTYRFKLFLVANS